MSRASVSVAGLASGKLSAGNEANNGTGGQQGPFEADKPSDFNTIGGVTGTHSATETRTMEQGMEGWTGGRAQELARRKTRLDLNTAPRKTVRDAKGALKGALCSK